MMNWFHSRARQTMTLLLSVGVGLGSLVATANAAGPADPRALHLSNAWAVDIVSMELLEAIEESQSSGKSLRDSFKGLGEYLNQNGQGIVIEVLFEKGRSAQVNSRTVPGATLEYYSEFYDTAYYTVNDPNVVLNMASWKGVRTIRTTLAPTTNVGISDSRADRSHAVDTAILKYKKDGRVIDGRSQKVGVLSDSFSTTAGVRIDGTTPKIGESGILRGARNQNSGDLPSEVQIVLDLRSPDAGIDEGAGMAELVHDIAPGAAIAFHTAFIGEASFADGIRRLWQEAGCTVIVDDVGYRDQPFYQDGIIAQAAEASVRAGVPYFSSIGNAYDSGMQFFYRDSNQFSSETVATPTGVDFHRWPNGTQFFELSVPPLTGFALILKWNQPNSSILGSKGCEVDLDFYVYSTPDVKGQILSSSTRIQGTTGAGTGDPVEVVSIVNAGTSRTSVYLAVDHFDGNLTSIPQNQGTPIEFRINGWGYPAGWSTLIPTTEIYTASFATWGHPLGEGVMSVAAVPWWESPFFNPGFGATDNIDPEDFTSLGGNTNSQFDDAGLYSLRNIIAPAISAVDGNNTTFFGSSSLPSELDGYEGVPDGFPNFFGTSAASPNAAAIAALMKDMDPSLTPADIRKLMADTAIDVTGNRCSPGQDPVTGPGLIDTTKIFDVLAEKLGIPSEITPTPTPTPIPTAVPESLGRQTFTFEETPESWEFISIPSVFASPVNGQILGSLFLRDPGAGGNPHTFGFYQSPAYVAGKWQRSGDRPLTGTTGADSLYRASFTVASDIITSETLQVPAFRVRMATENFEKSDVVHVSSVSAPSISPDTKGQIYTLYFGLPDGNARFRTFFDILNFDPADRAGSTLLLDRVTVDVLNATTLTGTLRELDQSFQGNANGWTFRSPLGFVAPSNGTTAEGLRLGPSAGPGSQTAFGNWNSPDNFSNESVLNSAPKIKNGRFYRARFRMRSNATAETVAELPAFRLRMNERSLNFSAYLNVESINEFSQLPTSSDAVDYNLYFTGKPALDGSAMTFAFDYLVPPGSDNDRTNLTLTLERLTLDSFQIPP